MKKILVHDCCGCPYSWLEIDYDPEDGNDYIWSCIHIEASGDPDGTFLYNPEQIPDWCPLEEN